LRVAVNRQKTVTDLSDAFIKVIRDADVSEMEVNCAISGVRACLPLLGLTLMPY